MGQSRLCGGDDRTESDIGHNNHQTDMNSKLVTSAATLLLLLCLVETGSGIKCHQCNSYDEYHCGDPFYYADTPDQPKTEKFLKDCPNEERNTSVGKSSRTSAAM